MATEIEVHNAISTILKDEKTYNGSLNWAVNYCTASRGMTGEELRVQCIYILSNIIHWRNPEAKNVRNILKAFTSNK